MNVYTAFLRGVNVGVKNRIPMAELKSLFEAAGLARVETVIQSGNVVFESCEREESLRITLETLLKKTFTQGESFYVALLTDAPDPEMTARLMSLPADGERCSIAGRDVYLLLGRGIRNSKLANHLQKQSGVLTIRNWKTIRRIASTAAARVREREAAT